MWLLQHFSVVLQALKQSYREVMLQSEYSLLKQLLNSNVRIVS